MNNLIIGISTFMPVRPLIGAEFALGLLLERTVMSCFPLKQNQWRCCGMLTAVAAVTGVVVWAKVFRQFAWGCVFLDSLGNQHVCLSLFADSPGNSS